MSERKIFTQAVSLEEVINRLHMTKEEKEKEYRFLSGIGDIGEVIFDGDNILGWSPEREPEKVEMNVTLN